MRFPGQYADAETGLHYNRFRTYDPGIGRYISADPIGQYFDINVYVYGFSSPTNWVDPSGLGSRQQRPLDTGGLRDTTAGPLHHDSFRYEDGTNSGFYDDSTVRSDTAPKALQDKYEDVGPHRDDALLRRAEANVKAAWDQATNPNAPDYSVKLPSHNCQDYADAVEAEYDRLLSEPGGMSVAPPSASGSPTQQPPTP